MFKENNNYISVEMFKVATDRDQSHTDRSEQVGDYTQGYTVAVISVTHLHSIISLLSLRSWWSWHSLHAW